MIETLNAKQAERCFGITCSMYHCLLRCLCDILVLLRRPGSFTCIRAELHLSRQFGYFGAQVYLPSASVVLISWISFWLNVDSVPARISLGLLTVLTMTTQFSSVRDKLPSVSYVTALDVWMSACLLFVITSLLEFALVNVLVRRDYTAIGRLKISESYHGRDGYCRSKELYACVSI